MQFRLECSRVFRELLIADLGGGAQRSMRILVGARNLALVGARSAPDWGAQRTLRLHGGS